MKKQYSPPALEVFGTVKDLTFTTDKSVGVVDGITLCEAGPLGGGHDNPSNVVTGGA